MQQASSDGLSLDEKRALAEMLDGTYLSALRKVFSAEVDGWLARMQAEMLSPSRDQGKAAEYAARAKQCQEMETVLRNRARKG